MSSRRGGRPGGRGWVHLRVMMRRCHRRSVPGVTILCARNALGSIRDSARQYRPVAPADSQFRGRPAQHRDLLPQHQYLGVLRGR